MTGLLNALHAGVLGFLFLAVSLCCGLVATRWLGVRSALALPVGFGCTSLAALIAFCAWWIAPVIGNVVSLALWVGGVAMIVVQLTRATNRIALRASLAPFAATILLCSAWLCLLHSAGGQDASPLTAGMPVDDQLPRMLADRIAAGNIPGPLAGDWLMSDRPPLLAAVFLLVRPFVAGSGLAQEVVSTLCQIMWLPALTALGSTLGFGLRRVAVGIFFAATSGFFLLNTLYTWPKLMAASLFIAAVTVVLEFNRSGNSKTARVAAATGALLALALLAHGSAWFSVLALAAFPSAWVALRRFGFKGIAVLAFVFLLVSAPWSVYTRFVDPPGNRLVKWHLAGAVAIDNRSSLEAIRDAYAQTPAQGLWSARMINLHFVSGMFSRNPGEDWWEYLRRLQFFHLLPAAGLPLLGSAWFLISRIRDRTRDRDAAGLIVHALATVLVWVALLFQPGGAIVHQGSYVPLALLIFLGGAGIATWRPAAAVGIAVVHGALFLGGWVFVMPAAAVSTMHPALLTAAAVLMLGALVALPTLANENPAPVA
jgi:hypothetical protein